MLIFTCICLVYSDVLAQSAPSRAARNLNTPALPPVQWMPSAGFPDSDSIAQLLQGLETAEKVNRLIELAKKYSMRNPGLSMQLAEQANSLAQQSDDLPLKATALNALSILHFYAGRNTLALECILNAIGYLNQEKEQAADSFPVLGRLESMYGNAGNIYQNLGQPDMALQMQLNALRISAGLMLLKQDDPQLVKTHITIVNNAAVLYWQMGDRSKAKNMLNEALKLARELQNGESIKITLNNIGLIYIDEQRFDDAFNTYQEALELGKKTGDSLGISGNYNNLGLIMEKMGRKKEAIHYYLLSLRISEGMTYPLGIANTCANLGRVYKELNRMDSALYFAHRGTKLSLQTENLTYLQKNYQTLYQVYKQMGIADKALEYHELSKQVSDSIFNEDRSRKIAEMEARFQNEKKEKENQILRQKIEIQQRTKLLILISAISLIILALYLLSYYRLKNRNLRQKTTLLEQEKVLQEMIKARLEDQLFAEKEINRLQQEKLEHQNRELSSRILHVISINEMIDDIRQTLEDSRTREGGALDQCMLRINQLLKESIDLGAAWDQFKMHFDEVNPGFFLQLQENYPDLSQHDLKLCAYYRINLGTKEIARMLNVSPAAVQKSRHRLRKKMEIPSDVEMAEFMSRF
ncbi:MAG TPA: tetratricopeptide repeat protein [Bacteroidales bacterium]|nr:tetratricopeptide repeat protein [Bacteroidales bacterium]HSA43614.1 tetratricopeptide repeat protein [Bacteroidales bacterium]